MVEVEVEAKEVPPAKAGFFFIYIIRDAKRGSDIFLCILPSNYPKNPEVKTIKFILHKNKSVKDLFSSYANDYARYRPIYPAELFAFIFKQLDAFDLAWDCGTGNGQSAVELSKQFAHVHATDISMKQLEEAPRTNNIAYAQEPAEHSSLADNSADLITISQALHWFDLPAFYAEVERVAKPEAIIAAWTYNLLQIDERTDALIATFYFETLKGYWDDERIYVDMGYANLPFPYTELEHPGFSIEANWTLKQLEGYLNTWSGLRKFINANKINPLDKLIPNIREYWQEDERRKISFPLYLKIAKAATYKK